MSVRLGASKTDSLTMEAHRDLGRLAHESAFEQQAGAEPQSRCPQPPSSGVPSVHPEGDPHRDTYSIWRCLPDETEKGAEGRLAPSECSGVGLSGSLNVENMQKSRCCAFMPRESEVC